MRNELNELATFAMVARERSFTRAAARLGVSQSALSHAIRGLERRLELQLLARTTKSVAPTAAGAALLKDLSPALEQIARALDTARSIRHRPAGRLRIVMSRSAAVMVLLPRLTAFAEAYPDIVLDVTTTTGPVDLVAGEFDAGIQLGEYIQKDMIAVRVTAATAIGGRGVAPLFRVTIHPPKTKRSERSSMHNPAPSGWPLSMGIRTWTTVGQDECERPAHRRRYSSGDSGRAQWRWPRSRL